MGLDGKDEQSTIDAEATDYENGSSAPEITQTQPPKKSWMGRYGVLLLVGVLVVAVLGSYFITRFLNQEDTTEKQLKVGVLAAFTGGASAHGHGISKGIQLAQKELDAANIEVFHEDSQCDPKVGQEAMQRLIDRGVQVVIGDSCSSVSVAVLPLANGSEVTMVSPGASSPALSIPNDYFFRVIPSDRWQGSFMAQTVYEAGRRRVAVFYSNEPYGSGMNKQFSEHFESLGGQVVASATAESDATDVEEQIDKLIAGNPDALFVAPNSILTGTAVVRTAHNKGLNVPYYGADVFYDETLIANAPEASVGLAASTFNAGTQSFKDALAEETAVQEQLYAAPQAYDAFHAVYRAYQQGARTGRDFKQVLPMIEFQGASANIKFNEDGELDGSEYTYSLFQVKDGAFVEVPPGEMTSAN